MGNLPKYTLQYEESREKWALEKDKTHQVVKRWDTKQEATTGGVLERVVGSQGGSVKIQKENGRFQEERTYPRSRDPRKSKG